MILGAILAGGQSRRFGSDKALALWNGRPLIAHVIAAIQPHVDIIVVCGRDYAGVAGIADRPTPGIGPLGALNAALHHAADIGCEWILTTACDTPDIDPQTVTRLLGVGTSAYVAGLPVMGVWRSADAALLDRHIAETDNRSMRGWIARIGATHLDTDPPINVNFAVDLERLGQ